MLPIRLLPGGMGILPLLFMLSLTLGAQTDFPQSQPAHAGPPIAVETDASAEGDKNKALLRDRQLLLVALIVVFVLSKSIMVGLVLYLRRRNRLIRAQRDQLNLLNNDLSEANRYLSDLVQDRKSMAKLLAHDLRTPLSVVRLILRNSADMKMSGGNIQSNRNIAEMQKAVETIESLTQKMIDIQEDGVSVYSVNHLVELKSVISEAISEYQLIASQRKVALTLQAPDETVCINGDAFLLGRAVGNLLSNAIRISPTGGKVRIYLKKEKGSVLVQVTDKGPGIDVASLPGLFDTAPTREKVQDVSELVHGYGLYLTKIQVQKMKGCISVANRPEGGAVFTLTFPVVEGMENDPATGARQVV